MRSGLLALVLFASSAAAQQEQYFTPSTAATTPVFDFRWDSLVRYDSIHLSGQSSKAPNISRWRSEARPEIDWTPLDGLRFGVRGLGELSSDSNRTNLVRLDNYRSNTAELDRFFVEARPANFTIRAGQFEMPFQTTEMLWDRDIQVLGGSVSYRQPLGASSAITATGGFFYGPQRFHDHSHIAAGQLTFTLGPPDGVRLEWSEAFWRISNLASTVKHFLRQNESETVTLPYGGGIYYESRFEILDSLARLRFPLGNIPVVLSADWAHNYGAREAKYRDGVELAVRIGRVGNPWDFEVFDVYQSVDRDAVLGAYNTDDWWFHSWYVGHRIGAGLTVLPSVEIRPSIVFQRRQDRSRYLQRYLVDVVKTF